MSGIELKPQGSPVWRWARRIAIATVLLVIVFPVVWVLLYRILPAPGTSLMVERAFQGETIQRRPVSLDEISPNLVYAVIAAEDSGFCAHDGFDVEAIRRAMEFNRNSNGRRLRGGSTISQQTAKNLFLWADRSWVRKGLEAYFTVLIEALWPKRRIMEAYLNAVEWGDGRFGAEAAARDIFGVAAADLTPAQAARLAAVLPSPNRWRADNPGPYVRRRAGAIAQRARVVRNEGLAACVFGEKPLAPARGDREDGGQERPAPQRLEPLPPPPAPEELEDPGVEEAVPELPVEELEEVLSVPTEPAPIAEPPPPSEEPTPNP